MVILCAYEEVGVRAGRKSGKYGVRMVRMRVIMSYKISGPIKVSDLHAKRREIVGPRGGQRGPFSSRVDP